MSVGRVQGWRMYILKYKFLLDINCQHFGIIIQFWIILRRAQGSVTYYFIFILDIRCQHLGNTCQLNLYTGIGYIPCQLLEDIYVSLEGFFRWAQLSRAQLSTPKKWTVGPRGAVIFLILLIFQLKCFHFAMKYFLLEFESGILFDGYMGGL